MDSLVIIGVLTELQGQTQAAGELEWVVSVDSTITRAHQPAAGARRALRGGCGESHHNAVRAG
jgi:hypothetical protein